MAWMWSLGDVTSHQRQLLAGMVPPLYMEVTGKNNQTDM